MLNKEVFKYIVMFVLVVVGLFFCISCKGINEKSNVVYNCIKRYCVLVCTKRHFGILTQGTIVTNYFVNGDKVIDVDKQKNL